MRIRGDLIAKGIPIAEPSHEERSIYLQDPDGAVLGFNVLREPRPQGDTSLVRHEAATAQQQIPFGPSANKAPRNSHIYNLLPQFSFQD